MQNLKPQRLSDKQVERLIVAIKSMKENNAAAAVTYAALEKQADLEGKRRVLVTTFAQTYELMLCMNMAIQSTVEPTVFESNLQDIRRQLNAGAN